MLPQFVVEGLQEHLIRDFPHIHAGIVQDGNDPFVLLLHQVHDDLVVEVINLQETKDRGVGDLGCRNGRVAGLVIAASVTVRSNQL